MTLIQAVILGIVQGLTEFVPISSSAHLIIIPWLFHWNDPSLAFDIALHLGTLVSLLWFFAADWVRLFRAGISSIVERKIGDDVDRRLAWFIIIGTIPGGIAGVLGEKAIEELFHKPNAPIAPMAMIAMAIIIALLGAALFVAERIAKMVVAPGQCAELRRAEDSGIGCALCSAVGSGHRPTEFAERPADPRCGQ